MPKLTKLNDLRLGKFLTLKELAEEAKIGTHTAWKATSGQEVSVTTAKKIAAALGVKPDKLL